MVFFPDSGPEFLISSDFLSERHKGVFCYVNEVTFGLVARTKGEIRGLKLLVPPHWSPGREEAGEGMEIEFNHQWSMI